MNVTRLQPAEIPQIWHCLQQISDPELPVLSITDLGMVRDVARDGAGWRVTFTPTYSGCPATEFCSTPSSSGWRPPASARCRWTFASARPGPPTG